jgi:hypothetical protein
VGGSEVANRIAARSAAEQDAFVLTHRLPVAREVVLPRPELGRELDVVPTGLWRWGSGFQGIRVLMRDRDSKYSSPFDEVFRTEGVRIITTPAWRLPLRSGKAPDRVQARI